jgi:hypothetical protein
MFSFFSKKDKALPEPSEQYTKLRNSLLTSSAGQFNIQPSGKNPDVWGVLIDENFGKYIQSVWVTAVGQIRIFQFTGENRIREDPRMADLLRLLLWTADACYSSLTPTTSLPLPSKGNIRFSIFTFTGGMYTTEVEVRELAISREKNVLAKVNNAYHAILLLNKWGKFQANTNWFKPSAVGDQTMIYSKPDFNSTPIADLVRGNAIELGVVKNVDGKEWITVTLPSGQWGYMPIDAKILLSKQLSLFENEAVVYSEPSTQSTVITYMKKNTLYYTIPSGSQDERWVKIRDSAGNEGFIDGQTRGREV